MTDHPEVSPRDIAILDDDADANVAGRLVRTHPRRGMYGKHERAVIDLLAADHTERERG